MRSCNGPNSDIMHDGIGTSHIHVFLSSLCTHSQEYGHSTSDIARWIGFVKNYSPLLYICTLIVTSSRGTSLESTK